jgi:hypothetical protein
MYEYTNTGSASCRLPLWLLAAILLTALPLAAQAQDGGGTPNSFLTCNARQNRADFDGDCKTDISTFNRSTGEWKSLNSSSPNGTQIVSVMWGQSGDIPTPGDYDGDGKDDIAVFRPSDSNWHILKSSTNSMRSVQFGVTSDWPVQADYDSDAMTDIAIFRPGTGTWWILKSSDGLHYAYPWGVSGDRPVPGDYDGDNRADVAVQRPSDGAWHIVPSSNNTYYSVYFVAPEFPVPGGYLTPLY